jgi:spectinomycin phosphotransferase
VNRPATTIDANAASRSRTGVMRDLSVGDAGLDVIAELCRMTHPPRACTVGSMKSRPVGFGDADVIRALDEGWGVTVESAEFAAVGFGSFHWIATDEDQHRFFVTVDDIGNRPWLGNTADSVFAGMQKAFDMVVSLRGREGLDFVLAPLRSLDGESVRRVGPRHSVAVFPFVDGESGGFSDDIGPERRAEMVRMLAELHQATPSVPDLPPPLTLGFAGRPGLEAAARDLENPWVGGPFAEPARAWLTGHAGDLRQKLDDFDQVVRAVVATQGPPVITHGEPHPGNVMLSKGKLLLIDWDTVALAPPERDLWLVASDSGAEGALYEELTGRTVNSAALDLYRQAWLLADVATYIELFRSPHDRKADTEDAWTYLERSLNP